MRENRDRRGLTSTCRAGRDGTTEPPPPKIVVFNVKYSPNLGDGIIAECLEHELGQFLKGAQIVTLDLAGRTHWSTPGDARTRLTRLALLQRMPGWIRDVTVGVVLGFRLHTELRPAWKLALADADLAVFGGGQLMQDGDLNFPLKLAAAASECHRRGLPVAIFAVGVAPSRSLRGRRLFRRLLRSPRLVHVAARDPQSVSELHSMGCHDVALCRDPGLLAARVWPASDRPARTRRLVGLGITHGALLRHHAGDGIGDHGPELIDLYAGLVDNLIAAGYDIVCFSNGAAEDEAIVAILRGRFSKIDPAGSRVRAAPRCRAPRDLAALIASFDAVIAHRLHACILAYSYKIPHLGLTWDGKLQAFFATVRRGKYTVPLNATTKAAIVPLLAEACEEGIDRAVHARVLAETTQGVRRLTDALVQALRNDAASRTTLPVHALERGSAWT
jgi:polysaccharide pyruvyl transferase WcaK-like protein